VTDVGFEVISCMVEYMQTHLEKPHPVFGGMPICPFARKARLENKISFQVYPFSSIEDLNQESPLLKALKEFGQSDQYEALLVIHPDKQAMTLVELRQFVDHLNDAIALTGLLAFGGHPQETFNIQSVYTRREPYINFTVQTYATVKAASDLLLKTHYYEHWSAETMKQVGFPRAEEVKRGDEKRGESNREENSQEQE
jgi:hypothetical protein